jgi:hypothetical protein
MQRVGNHVYKSSLQRLNICDLEFTECEWICPNSDELLRDDEHELLVDYEKPTQKE